MYRQMTLEPIGRGGGQNLRDEPVCRHSPNVIHPSTNEFVARDTITSNKLQVCSN